MNKKRSLRTVTGIITTLILLGITIQAMIPNKFDNPATLDISLVKELGVSKILLVQRNVLNPTHVYTYHQEGLKPGGGLWVCDVSGEKTKMTKIIFTTYIQN